MIDGVDEARVRRFIDRRGEPSVPQVLGRFGMDPTAEPAVRVLIDGKSPGAGGSGDGRSGESLYRRTSPPSQGGWGGYPPYPSPQGGTVRYYNVACQGGPVR